MPRKEISIDQLAKSLGANVSEVREKQRLMEMIVKIRKAEKMSQAVYLTHSSQDRRDAILRSLAGVEANLDFWRDPTNWYDKVVFLEAHAHAALGRSARRDSHRNPEAYQVFKASVTISFDLPYFAKNRAAGDNLVLT